MAKLKANIKYAADQWRLLIAEKMIGWAVDITPASHPDSIAIYEAAMHVVERRIAKGHGHASTDTTEKIS